MQLFLNSRNAKLPDKNWRLSHPAENSGRKHRTIRRDLGSGIGVFRSSPIPFSITTLKEGRFLDVNAAFERRYGYAREEVLGHTVHELRIWEDRADRVLMIEQLQRGGPIRNVITRLRTKSGEIKLTAYSADRIQFDGQSCILAVSEDLPEYDQHKAN